MLLVQLTVGSTVKYLSYDYIDIEHFYEPYILSVSQMRIETKSIRGGYADFKYGTIDISPDVFLENWPPPSSCAVSIYVTSSNEASAKFIVSGNCYLNRVDRDAITYEVFKTNEYFENLTVSILWPPFNSSTGQFYPSTLANIFVSALQLPGVFIDMNFTYDRTPSPGEVYYHLDESIPLLDYLSDLAEFYSHRFYIENDTLYLIDCLGDNGPVLELTESDLFPSSYTRGKPYKSFKIKFTLVPNEYTFGFGNTQGPNQTYVGLSEIQLRRETDGADETATAENGGVASAGSTYSTYVPAYAVDNNNTTRWLALKSDLYNTWWAFDFNSSVRIVEYVILIGSTIDYAPTSWYVSCYDHVMGVNFNVATIGTSDITTPWVLNVAKTFTIPATVYDRYASVSGSHSYGEEFEITPVCCSNSLYPSLGSGYLFTALNDTKTIMESPRVEFVLPLELVPKIGQRITLTDNSLAVPTTVWARVSSIIYNFDDNQCVVEGEGGMS